jgi:hypothetical protein
VSYTECGNRIYPHVYKFSNWREYARTFCQQMRNLFTPTDYQQEHARFVIYMNNVMLTFGKNLIRELSTIEVQSVDMNNVLRVVSTKLDNNSPSGMYRTCANIYLMIRSCELLCTTPFTKKFFNAIKMAMERMEARSQEGKSSPRGRIGVTVFFSGALHDRTIQATGGSDTAVPAHRELADRAGGAHSTSKSTSSSLLEFSAEEDAGPERILRG